MTDLPPEGWYPDPMNENGERLWDGTSWSEQYRLAPASASPPAMVMRPAEVTNDAPVLVATGPTATADARIDTVRLPGGVTIADPWTRLGAYVVDSVLMMITLGIGWLIWAVVLAPKGQTPAKKLLNLQVISANTVRPVGFSTMFWMRGVLAGIVAGPALFFSVGIVAFMPFWDDHNQNIWDKVSTTYVVHDPRNAWGM